MSRDPTTWLLTEGRRLPDAASTFAALCAWLREGGIPLERCFYGGLTLHPLVYASGVTWTPAGARHNRRAHGFERTPMWRNSPTVAVLEGAAPIRRRIGVDPSDYPVVVDLERDGMTDYYTFAVELGGRPGAGVSWATRRPGGFTDEEIARLDALRPALGAVLEVHVQREVASTLLETYLGADAGRRVLAGSVRRGDGSTVRAALWFSDLRDFTGCSDRLPRDAVLDLLDDAFEAQVAAIEAEGGSVLKFLGDGLLAMFVAGDDDGRSACAAAVRAARDLAARVVVTNRRREAAGKVPVRYGLALHHGDVQFGNIGAPQRLDFTVIGPAVNRAARLEALTSRLGEPVVLSAELAARCGAPVRSLGLHALKGVAEPMEVFAWREP